MIVLAVIGAPAAYLFIHATTPVRIGVLLDLSGGDVNFKEPLEWAKDTINSEGGIGGRKVELVYKDTGKGDINQLAKELLDDNSIRIIVGPQNSDDVYALAPSFIAKKKVLISPTATSGDIIRAFGGSSNGYYVWRTAQGDAAQVKVLLTILGSRGADRIALLAVNNTYGKTFYDWTGFFATEYGIDVPYIRQYDEGSPALESYVAEALKTDPDYIVAASWPEDAATIKKAMDKSGSRAKLFLTDAGAQPLLIRALGPGAEGLEGTNPTADPTTGFVEAYEQKFGHRPDDFAAPTYDALMIAAFTEARQDRAFFEPLGESVRQVVIGEATVTGWNATGIRTALNDIKSGAMPWITGASGGLEYDEKAGVDPLITWYANWKVSNGSFKTLNTISSENISVSHVKTGGDPIGLSRGTARHMSNLTGSAAGYLPVSQKKDFQAVIVGPSRGWKNYRHQADALTIYTMLRDNGVDDDHIILMLYDDIPTLPENPLRGDVHNIPKGQNIRSPAVVDYSGSQVTTRTFKDVLTGSKTASSPTVLESNSSTDVFVYIASHGGQGEIVFGSYSQLLTASDFTALTETMSHDRRYRQMAFFVDTCFGESMATELDSPGILYLTGASKNEPSLGAVYDMDIRQWLSDEFTQGFVSSIKANPDITFRELYPATYQRVTGSHVRMIDTGNFSLDMPVRKYLSP